MFRRILTTLDGSQFAEAALPAATALARKSGGDLRLLAVHDPGFAFVTESGLTVQGESAESRSAAEAYLEGKRAQAAGHVPRVTTAMRSGHPAHEILAEARDYDADLLVMATHGRSGLARAWYGSVAGQCVRDGHVPVLLVRPEATGADPLGAQRVVVPLDGSALAEQALGPAVALANLLGSRLTLTRLVPDLTVADPDFFPEIVAQTRQIVDDERAKALRYLEDAAAPFRGWGVAVDTRVDAVHDGAPAIVGVAGTDVIVIATHARTGIGRAFMGSVTDAVVGAAGGPVMVIPPGFRPAEARAPGARAGA